MSRFIWIIYDTHYDYIVEIKPCKTNWFLFFLVFLEHDQIGPYINEMLLQTEDNLGIKTFFCGVCQQGGKYKQDIERHIESHHIETNPFECEACGAFLKTRRALKMHTRAHHK